MIVGEIEPGHLGMTFEKLVNGLTQLPDAFAVDDTHVQNSARPTFRQIIEHEVLHLPRLKRVQVQHAVNRQLNWLVIHTGI